MSANIDGGPAFPTNGTSPYNKDGMSLRDWFAGKALQGLIANGKLPVDKRAVAQVAHEYADAMLRFRNQGGQL
jgi:hypothetical protein